MKVIQYIRLYEYLREKEGLEGIQILRNIYRLRKLPRTFLIEVEKLLNGQEPQIEVECVSYQELTEKDGMLPIRAILMLDWIRRDSYAAFKYMEKKGLRAPIKPLTTEEEDAIDEAIARLEKEVKEKVEPVNSYDESSEDIDVENAPSLDEEKTSLQDFVVEIAQEESLLEETKIEEQTDTTNSQKQESSKEETPLDEVPSKKQIELDENKTSEN